MNVKQPDARTTNLSLSPWPVRIQDFSSNSAAFNLDEQAFQLDVMPTRLSVSELKDLTAVKSRYHAEVTAFLKKKCGAKTVVIFDTTVSLKLFIL